MTLLLFGFGYTAQEGLDRFRSRFERVIGTVRSRDKASAIERLGIGARVFSPDVADPRLADDIAEATHVIVSVPPGSEGDPVLRFYGRALAEAPHLVWIGYLSTIGVYGDHRGGWVDETTPAQPTSPRSRQRLEAEQGWLDRGARSGKAVQAFRLAGIYGPGRNALANLKEGTARRIVKRDQVFNRVHVADIAATLMASMERPRGGGVYNVADDEPAPPQDVVAYAADLLGVPAPPEIPFAEASLSPMAASFYAENKRASNGLIRRELGVEFAYPTYREGLRALHAAGEGRAAS
jgi:nucleoside-diphosphate-sugar epimerase